VLYALSDSQDKNEKIELNLKFVQKSVAYLVFEFDSSYGLLYSSKQ
jgi:hypothetical protein